MKLKRYNDFINESFAMSKEYQDFLKSKAISLDIFYDSLFDVKQIASVNIYRYLVDSKGHSVNTEINNEETYKMLYQCKIHYTVNSGKNDIGKIIENLSTIKISIEEMIDRVENEGLKLKENAYKLVSNMHAFEVQFTSDDINKEELKGVYKDYISFQDKEYLAGLNDLRNIYRIENIDFDRYMDTVDDEEYIQVGVFIGDDLYGVGTYNKNTKVFSIDEDEIANSIYAYIEENQ